MLGQCNGSTATGSLASHGPGSSDDSRNTRRGLDTFSSPEDEQAQSAVLLRFPCEQYHKGITKWINNLWEESNMPADNKPVTIHCEAGSASGRLVFEIRAKCQDFVARYKDDGIPMRLTVLFAASKQQLLSANPDQVRTERSASNLHLCGAFWQISSKFSSMVEMTKVLLSSHCSTPAHKSSALRIEETGLENLCSNLPPLEVDKHLPLLHLICVVLVFLLTCCNGFCLKPTRPMCDGRLFASPLLCRLAVRGALFLRFPIPMGSTLCDLFGWQRKRA